MKIVFQRYWKLLLLAIIIVLTFPFLLKFIYKSSIVDNSQEDYLEVDYSKNEVFEYFPVRYEDFVKPAEMYGLWPYGIRGNTSDSHNEGHPGWDFELKKGSKVYAIGDLMIAQIHEGDTEADGKKLLVIEAYSNLKGKKYHIVYHSVVNLEPEVKEKAKIKAGEALAEAGMPLSEDSVMIHFGIFPPNDSIGSCPTPYFSITAQEILNKILALSIDQSTGGPYKSSCVGKIDRKLYEQNYPERMQYYGGAEQFE